MEHERPVTTPSAQLFPPASAHELAEAEKIASDTNSNTIAGLQRLVLLGAEQNMKTAERYMEDARKWSKDVLLLTSSVAVVLQELNAAGLGMQRDHAGFMEMARKPIQPRATVAESAAETVQHIVTELRKGLKVVFAKDPELQGKAQKALDGVVEQGKALIDGVTGDSSPQAAASAAVADPKATAAPAPAPAAVPSPPTAARPTYTRDEVLGWMEVVGQPFCEKLFARFGVKEPEDIKGPVIDALHEAFKLVGRD